MPEVSESTSKNYNRVYNLLLGAYKKYKKENQISDSDFSPIEFCTWLSTEKSNLAAHTWRQYRAASCYCIAEQHPNDFDQCRKTLSAIVQSNRATGLIRAKTKGYTEENFTRLLNYSLKMSDPARKSARSDSLFWWRNVYISLYANNLVGLRPSEWLTASISHENNQVELVVFNAKNTHGRSHGEKRKIVITALAEADLSVIAEKIHLTQSAIRDGKCRDIDMYQAITRRYLLKANNALFPGEAKTIAMYSTRHQVVTDMKSSNATAEEMAAILGHGSTETANNHYGKKTKRKGRFKPTSIKANEGDVAKVKQLNSGRQPVIPGHKVGEPVSVNSANTTPSLK